MYRGKEDDGKAPINRLYTGGFFHCHMKDETISHIRGVEPVKSLLFYFLMENPVSKQ